MGIAQTRGRNRKMGEVIHLGHATSRLKPKTPTGSKAKPRSAATRANRRKYSDGMAPWARQLETADAPTPAIVAAAPVPPNASINSSTERSMAIGNSRNVGKQEVIQTLHDTAVDISPEVKFDIWVGNRNEIIARLRMLPAILGKSDAELARICGVNPSAWSNYKSESASKNTIIWEAALELWNAYGIPMEWVYDGQVGRVTDPDLREKLALAHRLAEAERASKRPRRGSRGR
jgi:transcriptional regulator with XRE-family HTH domain